MAHHRHILLITYPAQGHINPSLQLAKKLTQMGVEVTFTTSASAHRRMSKTAGVIKGLKMVSFSDGYDEGIKTADEAKDFFYQLKTRGTECLQQIITSSAEQGRPVSCLVYTLFFPWVAEVARAYHLPSAFFWIQPATVFDIYYYYFNGYGEAMSQCSDPSWSINLPRMPLLHARDLPSFLLPASQDIYRFALPSMKQHIDTLDEEKNPKILVNTFDDLESDALNSIKDKFNLIPIGPVIPSAFLGGKDSSDTSVGGDLFQNNSTDYKYWLSSQPEASVIYISFGSMLELTKPQKEEMARALVKIGRPFLWVVRKKDGEEEKDEDKLSCMDELVQQGMIVPWCSQLEVLSHPSLGCFVTHCGWNSTLESLASGVPMVAFPKWTDQGTNAKLIEHVWKTGVRVNGSEGELVDGDEIYRCLEMVMEDGEKREEMRRNAKKWKDLSREAVKEGGSSDKNLKKFVQEVGEEVVA